MRIKIEGPITAERLADALQQATSLFGMHFGGFYGANLYVTAYTKDGESFKLVDNKGDDVMLTFGVPSGETSRPALSKAAKAERLEAKRARAEQEERERIARLEMQERHARREAERRQQEAKLHAYYKTLNDASSRLLQIMPEKFIDELNQVVRGVWGEMKPVLLRGKGKGQPRPRPWFEFSEGTLLLHRDESGKRFMRVKNPVVRKSPYSDVLEYHWQNEPWNEASKRMAELVGKLHKELPPEEER